MQQPSQAALPIVHRPNRWRLLRLALVCWATAGGALFYMVRYVGLPDLDFSSDVVMAPFLRLGFSFGATLVACFALLVTYLVVSRAPTLTIDEQGVEDFAGVRVRWDQITRVRAFVHINGERLLGIEVVDSAEVIAEQGLLGRLLVRNNVWSKGGAALCVPERFLETSAEEFARVIERERERRTALAPSMH
jgi:hypothetical protein